MRQTLVWATALVATVFAGCFGPTGPGGTLSREVDFLVDDEAIFGLFMDDPASWVEDTANVTYVYRHTGSDEDVAGWVAKFVDAEGANQTLELANLTSRTTLKAGDTVRIPGAGLTSDMVIERGSRVLASRTGVERTWLEAEGMPMPLAVGSTGTGQLDMRLDAGVGLSFNRAILESSEIGINRCRVSHMDEENLSLECVKDPDTHTRIVYSGASFAGNVSLTGSMQISNRNRPSTTELAVTGSWNMTSRVNASMQVESSETIDKNTTKKTFAQGMEGKTFVDARYDSRMHVAANQAVTGSLSGYANRTSYLHGWNETFSSKKPYNISDPVRERETFDGESLAFGMGDSDVAFNRILSAFWNMSLAPGDRLHVRLTQADTSVESTVDVTGGEIRTAGNTRYDTLRLRTITEARAQVAGKPQTLQASEGTLWIDATSYVPIAWESSFVRTFGTADLLPIVTGSGGVPEGMQLPSDMQLVLRGDASMNWTGSSQVIAGPGVLALVGAPWAPLLVLSLLPTMPESS